jgi:transcriptional regulator with XRE-family HTH domain
MGWIPKQGVAEKLRLQREMSISDLARATGLNVKTVRDFLAGRTVATDETTRRIARALSCEPEGIATEQGSEPVLSTLTPPPSYSPVELMINTAPDTKQAQRETQLGLHQPWIEIGGRRYPVIGFNRQKKIEFAHDCLLDDEWAVCGAVRTFEHIPDDAAAILQAEKGSGAAYFKIRRAIEGLGAQGGPELLDSTVFVPSAKQSNELQDCSMRGIPVVVILRLVVAKPAGGWRGFPSFDASKGMTPWALVSKAVLPGPVTVQYR